LASTEEVERKLEELIARLGSSGEAGLGGSLPDRRSLALHVRDLDAEWWTELEGGRLGPLHRGASESADIRITALSDDLVELIDGEAALFSAYLAGRVRIDASLSDLLLLRRFV
jgi:predicted lipid carrier protein YhbT